MNWETKDKIIEKLLEDIKELKEHNETLYHQFTQHFDRCKKLEKENKKLKEWNNSLVDSIEFRMLENCENNELRKIAVNSLNQIREYLI